MYEYNIHELLFDLFRIKSKFLCKHNIHNFMLKHKRVNLPPTVYYYKDYFDKIIGKQIEFNRAWVLYNECYCCGEILKERSNKNETRNAKGFTLIKQGRLQRISNTKFETWQIFK